MNIFVLDKDPIKAAQYCIDRHVIKMPLESAQMMANAFTSKQLINAPKKQNGEDYKGGWLHHPCTKWVLESYDNFEWLLIHSLALCDEKTIRYPSRPRLYIENFLLWIGKQTISLPTKGLTKFALAMPEACKVDDEIQSYRNYYIKHKKFDVSGKVMNKWTNRGCPWWYK